MNKKALILDLDNTVYAVSSIGDELFESLFELIITNGSYDGELGMIKKEVMRRPFQHVALDHQFSDQLTNAGIDLLKELTYNKKIEPFEDYPQVRKIPCKKFLVTSGFTKMQQSKVKQLGIEQDFEEIHIVDPMRSDGTKKDVFKDIIERHNYSNSDVLVIGDDPNSEIKGALELGVDAILYNKLKLILGKIEVPEIVNFKELYKYLK